jgi:hypothetical protein
MDIPFYQIATSVVFPFKKKIIIITIIIIIIKESHVDGQTSIVPLPRNKSRTTIMQKACALYS